MNPPDNRESSIFRRALDLPPEEREAFVAASCAGDDELRDRVLKLLQSHEVSGGFLESLPADDLQAVAGRLERSVASAEKPGDQIGRYRLLERVGEGAWGTVWRARQTEGLEREVALKILKLGLDTKEFLARFEAERKTLALMDHPNIARVLDAGATDQGRPYFVMELVKGMPLIEFANKRRLTLEQRLELFVRICRGIDHAHAKGVIHRDLKPSNILVTVEGDENVPKIIDFGVAKSTQFQLTDKTLFTGLHSFIGTPTYSSPEQLEFSGMEVDPRSDVYSLGAVLYKLLCGRPPFDLDDATAGGLEALRLLIREKDPPRLSVRFAGLQAEEQAGVAQTCDTTPPKLLSRLRGDLDWIIGKCLEKDRSRRYASALALADDIQAHLAGDPISARAPSLGRRLRRFVKRHRPAYAIWVEVPAVALVALAAVLYFRSEPDAAAESERREVSIAVLPFENRSEREEDITEGIYQILHKQLTRIPDFRVISQTTIRDFADDRVPIQEMADRIDAKMVVAGSAGVSGGQVRVNIELVDARLDKTLWGETYSRTLTTENLFLIQMQIAADIARFLETRLSPEEQRALESLPSKNFEALEAFFEAVNLPWHGNQEREFGPRVIALLERAVELDRDFAMAWEKLGMAFVNFSSYLNLPVAESRARAQDALRRALDLDPRMPDAWTSLAFNYNFSGNIEAAEEAAMRAIELDPTNSRALRFLAFWIHHSAYHDPVKAMDYFEKAKAHLPENAADGFENQLLVRLGRIDEAMADGWQPGNVDYFWLGQFDQALQMRRLGYQERPDYPNHPLILFLYYYALRLYDQAAFFLQRRIDFFPDWQEEDSMLRRIFLNVLRGNLAEANALFWQAQSEVEEPFRSGGWELGYMLREMMVADHAEGRIAEPRKRYFAVFPEYFERGIVVPDKPVFWRRAQDVAVALHANGEIAQANHLLDEIIRNIRAYPVLYPVQPLFARALFVRGEREAALEVLRETPVGHLNLVFDVYFGPEFVPLRDDPEFEAIMAEPLRLWNEQRERVIEWEKNGELAEIPPLPEAIPSDA